MLNANRILAALATHAQQQPDSLAVACDNGMLSYAELERAVRRSAEFLRASKAKCIALALDNSAAWTALDLGAMAAGTVLVPLPFFFSAQQVVHAIHDAGAASLVTDRPEHYEKLLAGAGVAVREKSPLVLAGRMLTELRLTGIAAVRLPAGTAKITYTSGTTGQPKGVCLSVSALEAVSLSLLTASGAKAADRHLSALPLSTLLENIGGIYVPLLAGASCLLPPLAKVGLSGASGLDADLLCSALAEYRAHSTILTPEMLLGLVSALEAGRACPARLRFIAVGGASVAPRLLQRAEAAGLPVFDPNAPRWLPSIPRKPVVPAASASRCRMPGCASPRTARSSSPAPRCWVIPGLRRCTRMATTGPPGTWGGWTMTVTCTSPAARRTCSSPRSAATSCRSGWSVNSRCILRLPRPRFSARRARGIPR
jgi:long-chain acyl-CoA synthetase